MWTDNVFDKSKLYLHCEEFVWYSSEAQSLGHVIRCIRHFVRLFFVLVWVSNFIDSLNAESKKKKELKSLFDWAIKVNLCFDNNCIYVLEDQHHQQRMTTSAYIQHSNWCIEFYLSWYCVLEQERVREEEIVRTYAPSNRQTKNNDSKENRSLFLLQN